ncbi:hypothetical protein [Petroclostridium sp. X23]|uniref:hypothetical protein n=1 Tax=Petroclostridium sp. X23 TaxID=3045146 RepID=UPI0024ADF46C|nr:hypothetical protein [Petroclostridium sp. X23]WHH57620.1 hypothetical protein QKW49_17550 [Petroclostridium sp. X23]
MLHENARQVVVIKDINSNIIEEAILVLKSNADVTRHKKRLPGVGNDPRNSDNIIKEAQNIIDNYIKQYSAGYEYITSASKTSNVKKSQAKKRKVPIGTLLNVSLVVSIALLLYLLSRAF